MIKVSYVKITHFQIGHLLWDRRSRLLTNETLNICFYNFDNDIIHASLSLFIH